MGTKRYAAPELQRADTPFVALPTSAALAVDIFSLGQMLRYMLTGLPPGQSHLEYLDNMGILMPLFKVSSPSPGPNSTPTVFLPSNTPYMYSNLAPL